MNENRTQRPAPAGVTAHGRKYRNRTRLAPGGPPVTLCFATLAEAVEFRDRARRALAAGRSVRIPIGGDVQ